MLASNNNKVSSQTSCLPPVTYTPFTEIIVNGTLLIVSSKSPVEIDYIPGASAAHVGPLRFLGSRVAGSGNRHCVTISRSGTPFVPAGERVVPGDSCPVRSLEHMTRVSRRYWHKCARVMSSRMNVVTQKACWSQG